MFDDIWQDLGPFFEQDDGSLPEIDVGFSSPEAMIAAFDALIACASVLPASELWDVKGQCQAPVPETGAAALLLAGEVEPFHVLLKGIRRSNWELPDLGVFVFSDGLSLDYRMGQGWGIGTVRGLLIMLRELGVVSIAVPWWRDVPGAEAKFRYWLQAA